jgi:hypothetical protein
MKQALLLATAAATGLVTCGGASGTTRLAACTGSQVAARFGVVPGSAGAGNISYRLTLENTSTRTCTVTGLPRGQLLGRTGRTLPTRIRAAFRPGLAAVLVRIAPGKAARATARFSPDVPGVGEQTIGACEPKAYTLRVVLEGGGTANARLAPATPVCEHGTMSFSAYTRL